MASLRLKQRGAGVQVTGAGKGRRLVTTRASGVSPAYVRGANQALRAGATPARAHQAGLAAGQSYFG